MRSLVSTLNLRCVFGGSAQAVDAVNTKHIYTGYKSPAHATHVLERAPARAVRPPLRHRARAGVLRGGARGAARDGREAQRGAAAAGGRGRHVPGGRARDGRRAPAAAAHGGRAHVRAAGVGAGGAVRRVSGVC